MSVSVDELRPLTAGRLLTIRREVRDEAEDALDQALLCNAQVLSESCFQDGQRAFQSREAVLEELTCREMESLLRALASGQGGNGRREAASPPG